MAGWNYRLMRHVDESVGESCVWYAIHEVYYDENNEPTSWTKKPIDVCGDGPEDVRWQLEHMLKALGKPALEYESPSSQGTDALFTNNEDSHD